MAVICDHCRKPITKRGDLVVASGFYGAFNLLSVFSPVFIKILSQLVDVFNYKKFHAACWLEGSDNLFGLPFTYRIFYDMAFGNLPAIWLVRPAAYVFLSVFVAVVFGYVFFLGFLNFPQGDPMGAYLLALIVFMVAFIGLKVLYPAYRYLELRGSLPR